MHISPTEIYNNNLNINNNHDTNSGRPEIGFQSSVVGRNDAKESSPDDNTVLMAQAPPRGASAHARYLAASKISARQDGHTVLVMRRVFAVSPRSALSHSNLATCFQATCYILHLSVKYGILCFALSGAFVLCDSQGWPTATLATIRANRAIRQTGKSLGSA